jgi:hypothetical protein
VSLPSESDPAGIGIEATPPVSVIAADVKPPPDKVTVPVGEGLPNPPFNTTFTVSACFTETLFGDGITETPGAVFAIGCTVSIAEPVALLSLTALVVSGA